MRLGSLVVLLRIAIFNETLGPLVLARVGMIFLVPCFLHPVASSLHTPFCHILVACYLLLLGWFEMLWNIFLKFRRRFI